MEIAAIISVVLGDYVDFGLIIALLFLNATIGYYEEHSSGNAIAALKAQLAPTCKVLHPLLPYPSPHFIFLCSSFSYIFLYYRLVVFARR